MKYSQNYHLYLPEGSDYVTPEQYNANFVTLDGKLKEMGDSKANSIHGHGVDDISGVLSIVKGGTGHQTPEGALGALIGGTAALASTELAANDVLGMEKNGVGRKITVADLFSFLNSGLYGAKLAFGSYVGTGTYGESSPNSLTTPFLARLIWILGFIDPTDIGTDYRSYFENAGGYNAFSILIPQLLTETYSYNAGLIFHATTTSGGTAKSMAKKSADGRTVSWYTKGSNYGSHALEQGNELGVPYFWIALA